MPTIDDYTPIALVITKADRRYQFEEFQEQDHEKLQKNIKLIITRIKQIYMPLIKQRDVKIFLHSSVGDCTSVEDAFDAGQEFPSPYGVEKILEHCFVRKD